MSETWPVYDLFSPILIGNYIRFETALKVIRNAEAENKSESVLAKFKIAKEYFEQLSEKEAFEIGDKARKIYDYISNPWRIF